MSRSVSLPQCTTRFLVSCILPVLFFLWQPAVAQSQETDSTLTTVILVRHAEKADDGTSDPPLTNEGQIRAQKLANMLAQAGITAIFSTDYKRTRMTVQPLASRLNLEIQGYDARSMDVIKQIMNRYAGKTVLVAGHSNTTPALANLLIGNNQFTQFKETEYGKILIATTRTIGNSKIIIVNY